VEGPNPRRGGRSSLIYRTKPGSCGFFLGRQGGIGHARCGRQLRRAGKPDLWPRGSCFRDHQQSLLSRARCAAGFHNHRAGNRVQAYFHRRRFPSRPYARRKNDRFAGRKLGPGYFRPRWKPLPELRRKMARGENFLGRKVRRGRLRKSVIFV